MRTWWLVVFAVCGLTGCRGDGMTATPDGRDFPHVVEALDRHAPTGAELANLRYDGLTVGPVTLQDGDWRGGGGGGADAPTVALLKDPQLAGDLTGNGTNEAVVLLQERRPGVAPRLYVAVVASVEGRPVNVATAPLGRRRPGGRRQGRTGAVRARRPASGPGPSGPAHLHLQGSDLEAGRRGAHRSRLHPVNSRPTPAARS